MRNSTPVLQRAHAQVGRGSDFSRSAGGVIGQPLAMGGVFAFFLESTFLYALVFGEVGLGSRGQWVASLLLFAGTWLSGFFIVCANAWRQHPVGNELGADGVMWLEEWHELFLNPWAWVQYAHTMLGTVVTACFTVAATNAFYLLKDRHRDVAEVSLRIAVWVGWAAAFAATMPTGDLHTKMVA